VGTAGHIGAATADPDHVISYYDALCKVTNLLF
jgi:hypothetical protein